MNRKDGYFPILSLCAIVERDETENCEQAAVALAIPSSSRCRELCEIFACLLSAVRKKKKARQKKNLELSYHTVNGASNFLEIVVAAYIGVMFTFLYFSAFFYQVKYMAIAQVRPKCIYTEYV